MTFKNILYKKYGILIFLCIIFFHVYLLTRLIFFPFPELFIFPYLINKGFLPYTQIWDNHFPGPFFLPINVGTLGLLNEVTARYWQVGFVVITHILIFYITKLITKNTKVSLFANFLFLVWNPFLGGWALWIDSFMGVFYLIAFVFAYKFLVQKNKHFLNVFFVGLFLGISFTIKQIALPVAFSVFLILFLNYRKPKTFFIFALGFLPLNIIIFLYLYSIGVFKEFWYWTFIYNLSDSAKLALKSPEIQELFKTFLIYSPILMVFKLKEKSIAFLFIAFVFSGLVGYADRFDTIHLQPTLPFIVILSSILLFLMRGIIMKSFFLPLFLTLYLLFTVFWLSAFYSTYFLKDVWYFDKQTLYVSSHLKQLTKPDEEVFIFGPVSSVYVFSGTVPVGKVYTLIFPWTMAVVEDKYVEVLTKNPPRIILRDLTTVTDGKRISEFAPKIDNLIKKNYETFESIDNYEFMKPKK